MLIGHSKVLIGLTVRRIFCIVSVSTTKKNRTEIMHRVFDAFCHQSDGYDWDEDLKDPCLYAEEVFFNHMQRGRFFQNREWPDEAAPPAAAEPVPGPSTVIPAVPAVPGPNEAASAQMEAQKKTLLQLHRMVSDSLKSLGVDAHEEYVKGDMHSVLARVRAEDTTCEICKMEFSKAPGLRRHIQLIHLGLTDHKCGTCDKYFGSAQSLRWHAKKHSGEVGQFPCTDAAHGKKGFPIFFTLGALNEHMKQHGEGYVCDTCKKRFNVKSNLTRHKNRGCTGAEVVTEKLYACLTCEKAYFTKAELDRHLRTHDGHVAAPLPK